MKMDKCGLKAITNCSPYNVTMSHPLKPPTRVLSVTVICHQRLLAKMCVRR